MGNILSTSFFFLSLAFYVREKLGRSKRSDCRVFVLILVHPYIGHHNKDDIEIEVLTCEDGYNIMLNKKSRFWTSLVVQWLRLCASTAEGVGSIPGWGSSTCHVVRPKKKKERKKEKSSFQNSIYRKVTFG